MCLAMHRSHWLHRLCALLSAGRRLGLIVILVMAHGTATFAGTLEVVRPLAEAPGDIRYDHYWQLLMQTLRLTLVPLCCVKLGCR